MSRIVSLYKNKVNYKTEDEERWVERAIYSPRDFITQLNSELHNAVSSHHDRVEVYKTMVSEIMDVNGIDDIYAFPFFMMNFIRKRLGKEELKVSDII